MITAVSHSDMKKKEMTLPLTLCSCSLQRAKGQASNLKAENVIEQMVRTK
jgi:hypothetical protein